MKRLALLVCLFIPALALSQAFPLFKPANGILKGSTSTYVTTAATASDVISLWTGSCSSTTFLRGDGSCQAPGGAGIGTVTSVGLAWTGSGLTVSNSPVTSAGTLTFSGALNVATGGTGTTTLTGVLKGNGTSAFSAAAVSDVISLWSGTCNSTTFLRADGSCQTVAGTTDASTLTTGTLADARLSSNVPLKNAANVFTAAQTVSLSPASTGQISLKGSTTGAANQAFITFADSAGTRKGYAGDANTGDSAIVLANDTAGADLVLQPGSGGLARVNNDTILTTVSGLNGSNVTTGTVADARLSANVAIKSTPNQDFSVTGSNSLRISNNSTGYSTIDLNTNGIQRFSTCTSTTAAVCIAGDSANDTSLRASGGINISTNGIGNSAVAKFSNSQITMSPTNFNLVASGGGMNIVATTGMSVSSGSGNIDLSAVNVTANSSRINTVANSGRIASARSNSSGVIQSGSVNVTGISRSGVGSFLVDVTAAGFTQLPTCVASITGFDSDAKANTITNGVASISVTIYASLATADRAFSLICNGF